MALPTFTPTPVVTGASAANMPEALGTRIGATTDANFAAARSWGNGLSFSTIKSIGNAFTYPAGMSASALILQRFGSLVLLSVSITRVSGTALVSGATGAITTTTMATRTTLVPMPLGNLFFAASCSAGPILNMYFSTSNGNIILRGCSQPSFTFPSTWNAHVELWYFS